MSFFQALLLGAVQGITEFLPVSSSGHLAILQNLFHWNSLSNVDVFFDVLLHFGTLCAILAAYRRELWSLLLELYRMARLKKPEGASAVLDRRMILLILLGTLPLGLAMLFRDRVEALYQNMFFIGICLLVTGLLLYVSDHRGHGGKDIRKITVLDAVAVGFGQMLAVVPGLSRSGTTISAGLWRGFDREFAVKFSFFLSIPAVLGANLLSLIDAIQLGIDWAMVPTYIAGMAVAAVFGFFSISVLNYLAKQKRFGGFAYYCWVAGIVTLFLAMIS